MERKTNVYMLFDRLYRTRQLKVLKYPVTILLLIILAFSADGHPARDLIGLHSGVHRIALRFVQPELQESLSRVTYLSAVQKHTVSGTVTDENGEPLTGVTVYEKGTSNGTITDSEGRYSITVGTDAVLAFSYIGYTEQEVTVSDKTLIDVALSIDIAKLEDVVVIGYGKVKKNDLTGAVAVVSAEDLNRIPVSNFQQALQGQAAGVLVTSNSGLPGAGAS